MSDFPHVLHSKVSSVCDLKDVTDAGSGMIITAQERAAINLNTAKVGPPKAVGWAETNVVTSSERTIGNLIFRWDAANQSFEVKAANIFNGLTVIHSVTLTKYARNSTAVTYEAPLTASYNATSFEPMYIDQSLNLQYYETVEITIHEQQYTFNTQLSRNVLGVYKISCYRNGYDEVSYYVTYNNLIV